MIPLSRPRRARRAHEWSSAKAVTFIVTLAATRCVTLAVREAGMSRKSAYALKARDSVFAEAWRKAVKFRPLRREGDKADRADTPPAPAREGDSAAGAQPPFGSSQRRAQPRRVVETSRHAISTGSMAARAERSGDGEPTELARAHDVRDDFFASLAAGRIRIRPRAPIARPRF